MKIRIYLLLKLSIFLAVFTGIFYVLEYGFDLNSWDKFPVPVLLSAITTTMLFRPSFKRHVLYLVGICFTLMILANTFNLLNFSSMIGGFGFSLLIVTIFLYLPQIIKKGHIEKF